MEDKTQLPINVNHNQIPEKEASIYVIPEIILGVKYALFQYWDTEKKNLLGMYYSHKFIIWEKGS